MSRGLSKSIGSRSKVVWAAVGLFVLVVAATQLSSAFASWNQAMGRGNPTGIAAPISAPVVVENYVKGPGCTSSPGLSLQNGDLSLLGFLMYQNSSGTICVSYTFQPVESQTNVDFQEYVYVFLVTATAVGNGNGYGFSYSKVAAPGISVSASPSSITLAPGTTTTQVQVQYTVVTTSGSKGFFSLNYLDSCPAFIPFSVGYGTTGVNASDFHGFFLPSSCISMVSPIVGTPQVVGYGGMGTSLITAQNETT